MAQQAAANTGLASEKEARDVAEAARESEWSGPSFVRELFLGRFRLDLIHPHPVRREMPVLDEGPHRGYAIQWFFFAATALVGAIFVVWRERRTP